MKWIRASIGTANMLGLERIKMDVEMKTAYLLTYHKGRCKADCKFCAQARNSKANIGFIARGLYKPYPFIKVVNSLVKSIKEGKIKRVCLQTINYDSLHMDTLEICDTILSKVEVPISVSRHPLSTSELNELKDIGVDRIVIPLDAVTEEIFNNIKPTYRWEEHWNGLKRALKIFGPWRVGTHLILGLGETEKEAIETLLKLHELKINTALFAFVPIKGTGLENLKRPKISSYRRIQLSYYLIKMGINKFYFKDEKIIFDHDEILDKIIESGEPFLATGCPDCNRPYSTERPSSTPYNFPTLPSKEEIEKIKIEIGDYS